MRSGTLLFICISAALMECHSPGQGPQAQHRFTNHLAQESSPYLLQHAHNPVNWYPWGEVALEKARAENKMLIVSIGYAACHWCHVMEHESFEDSTVAAMMNEHFVSIKVDREERPDIDDVYMTACHLATGGNCGWPLNSFALPDGRPVWAGTYFPKKEWLRVLEYFVNLKATEPDKLNAYADSLTLGITQNEHLDFATGEREFTRETMVVAAKKMTGQVDRQWGGRKGAPKFPMPNNYQFLMRFAAITDDAAAREAVITTLNQMALGGIYDQVGGGFARYSVDAHWHVPHFEKMLYDNGQLVSLYADAYRWTGDPLYGKVVEQTLEFVNRELSDASGGFYSSLDADSEGEEGRFYVWTKEEVDSIFSDPLVRDVVTDYYDIRSAGNWENRKNVLRVLKSVDEVAKKAGISVARTEEILKFGRQHLFESRAARIRPGLDDKILTAWNALMMRGYLDAYRAFGRQEYLDRAIANAEFIEREMLRPDGGLNRNFKDGKSSINAFLDDYALLIDAWIALYQATFDERWLNGAHTLTEYVLTHFYDPESGMFYYTSDIDPPLIARKKELSDNVIPASNSVLARDLLTLGLYFYEPSYLDHAHQMLHNMHEQIATTSGPGFYSNWLNLYFDVLWSPYEIAIVGRQASKLAMEMMAHYLPNAIYLGGTDEGHLQLLKDKHQADATVIYVCQNKVCKFPVQSVDEALKLVE